MVDVCIPASAECHHLEHFEHVGDVLVQETGFYSPLYTFWQFELERPVDDYARCDGFCRREMLFVHLLFGDDCDDVSHFRECGGFPEHARIIYKVVPDEHRYLLHTAPLSFS